MAEPDLSEFAAPRPSTVVPVPRGPDLSEFAAPRPVAGPLDLSDLAAPREERPFTAGPGAPKPLVTPRLEIKAAERKAPDLSEFAEDRADRASFGERLLQRAAVRPANLLNEIERRHLAQLGTGITDIFSAPTMLGKAWGGLEALGGAFNYLASPFEWVAAGTAEPVAAYVTGSPKLGKAIGRDIGEWASFAAQVGLDPLAGMDKVTKAARASKVGSDVEKFFSPSTVSQPAAETGAVIRERRAREALDNLRSQAALHNWQGLANRLPEETRFWDFFRSLENGLPQQVPELQPLADAIRGQLDDITGKIQALGKTLGKDWLAKARANYVGHIWEDREAANAVFDAADRARAAGAAKRPIQGSKAFMKQRTYEYMDEARAAGLKPVTTDPVEYALLKIAEMQKFYHGTLMGLELKGTGHLRFVPWNQRLPPGMVYMEDPYFKAILPPETLTVAGTPGQSVEKVFTTTHEMSVDKQVWEGIQKLGDALGIKVEMPLRSTDPLLKSHPGTMGYADPVTGNITNVFGSYQGIFQHEIGHALEFRYKLSSLLHQNKEAWRELADLALNRVDEGRRAAYRAEPWFAGLADQNYGSAGLGGGRNYLTYLLDRDERIANFFHGYWHAPELTREMAPTAYAMVDHFIKNLAASANPVDRNIGKAIGSIKPSLEFTQLTKEEIHRVKADLPGTPDTNLFVPGWRNMGQWAAPEDVARVFNNYVSEGIAGKSSIVDGVRRTANALNMAQLGLSAFHVTFTTLDTQISEVSRGLERAMAREYGAAAKSFLAGAVPVAPAVWTMRRGARLRSALFEDPASLDPAMREMVQDFLRAGGRPKMDAFYRAVDKGIIRGWRDGTFVRDLEKRWSKSPFSTVLSTPFRVAGMVLQDISHPIMEFVVPRQKLGVFYNLAEDFVRRNPLATPVEKRVAMQKIWDSVDNRLGQMVYDNVFWNKTFKDLSFIAVRSVGWNLGTQRELVGALIDARKAASAFGRADQIEFTHRMAYAIAMPVVTAFYGAMLTYMYTGRGPQTTYDYFFPPTGKKTPKGDPERIIIPSYMKDVLEYNREPFHTLASKLNPVWAIPYQMYTNRDFYGGIIVDPGADVAVKGKEFTQYLASQFTPFSVRSAQRLGREGSTPAQQVGSFFGFQAAPAWITAPERAEAYQKREEQKAIRRRQRLQAQGLR